LLANDGRGSLVVCPIRRGTQQNGSGIRGLGGTGSWFSDSLQGQSAREVLALLKRRDLAVVKPGDPRWIGPRVSSPGQQRKTATGCQVCTGPKYVSVGLSASAASGSGVCLSRTSAVWFNPLQHLSTQHSNGIHPIVSGVDIQERSETHRIPIHRLRVADLPTSWQRKPHTGCPDCQPPAQTVI